MSSNWSNWKEVVPRPMRLGLLRELHDDLAHLGIFKTFQRVAERFYWPRMKVDIRRYVASCKVCLSQKATNVSRPGFMGKEKIVKFPFQMISVDLVGPLPRSSS